MTTTHGGFLPEKQMTIARAAWRLDGLVSLDAGPEPGTVETVPLRPAGDRLRVNADASDGELRIAVLDANGAPIPGFGAADCIPVRGDSLRHAVHWRTSDRLPPDRNVKLRFELTNTSLYSYRVVEAPNG
jgi:hypothetical protein